MCGLLLTIINEAIAPDHFKTMNILLNFVFIRLLLQQSPNFIIKKPWVCAALLVGLFTLSQTTLLDMLEYGLWGLMIALGGLLLKKNERYGKWWLLACVFGFNYDQSSHFDFLWHQVVLTFFVLGGAYLFILSYHKNKLPTLAQWSHPGIIILSRLSLWVYTIHYILLGFFFW